MLFACLIMLLKRVKVPLVTEKNSSVFVCKDGHVLLEVSRQP